MIANNQMRSSKMFALQLRDEWLMIFHSIRIICADSRQDDEHTRHEYRQLSNTFT